MCIVTRCWLFVSGRIVGRSVFGSRAMILFRRSVGACIMMYFDSRVWIIF